MDQFDLLSAPGGAGPVSGSAEKSARGRPKGSKNKASGDLLRFISHETQGLTPGQQLARLVMVTPRDIRNAKKWALEGLQGKDFGRGRIDIKALDPVVLALSYKADQLAMLNGWSKQDAWALMMKAKSELMAYVHQKQGSVAAEAPDRRATILTDSTAMGSLGNPSQGIEKQAELFYEAPAVAHAPSHIDE